MSYIKSEQITNPNGITDEAAHIILEGSYKYFILAPLEELGKHVLSFWVKGKTAGNMAVSYGKEQKEVSITTDWQRVIFKFEAKTITNIWIYFSATEYYMYNTQLELGEFATDYSRNPKEVEDEFKQDIADTKEQVEQYRKETSAQILITQESITQSVTSLEERISKDYYTKTEANSIISQTQNGILQTVSANITETRNYADTVATNKANAAQANAINDTTNRLKSYSTTTQMNSAIDQRADSITSTVNKQITETKTYADTAATNAKNAAITDTTNKLKSYSTTTQMNTAIEQKANSITSTVAATYTTKTETANAINNINVGNRNILLKTNQGETNWGFTFQNGTYSKASATALGVNACRFTITTASTGWAVITYNGINRSIMSPNKAYTLEFDILPNKAVSLNVAFMQSNGVNSTGYFGAKSFPANTWGHYSGTVTFNSTAIGSQVIYITGLNATGLQFTIANLILVEGNKCGSWNPAPEDIETTVTETKTQLQSQITQTQSSILQTVSATYATNGTVDQVKSSVASVEVTANKINWLVKSGTSASNFTLTDRTATLVADYINLKGIVEFSGLNNAAQTKINNAESNASTAKNRVDSWSSANNTTLIDGGKIYTGSITADKLKVADLSALKATIAGWHIGESAIYRTSADFYAQNGMYFGVSGISISNQFKVDSFGNLYSGTSTTYTLLNSGNIHFYESSAERMMLGSGTYNGTYGGSSNKISLLNAGYSAKALCIGRKTSSSDTNYSNSIIINNGLNPNYYTEGVIFYATTRFASSVVFGNAVTFNSNVTFSNNAYVKIESSVYVSGTSFCANRVGIGGNSYSNSYALYVNGDSYFKGNMTATGNFKTSGDVNCNVMVTNYIGLNCGNSYNSNYPLYVVGDSWLRGDLYVEEDLHVSNNIYAPYIYNANVYANYLSSTGGATIAGTAAFTGLLSASTAGIYSLGVGIGTYNTNYNLYVFGSTWLNGSAYVQSGAAITSDRNLKKDIETLDIEKTIRFLKQLIPTSFVYKDNEFGRKHHGFIAQEVKEAMGEDDWGVYVDTSYSDKPKESEKENDSFKALRYEEIIPDVVLAIQYCLKEIEKLKQNY